MKFRKATKEEIPVVAEIFLEAFTKPPFNEELPFGGNVTIDYAIKTLEFFTKRGSTIYVAEDEEILGGIMLTEALYWQGKVIIIEDFAVKTPGKGIGSMMLEEVEKLAKEKKAFSLVLLTSKDAEAVKFYEKRGFNTRGKTILMEKTLS